MKTRADKRGTLNHNSKLDLEKIRRIPESVSSTTSSDSGNSELVDQVLREFSSSRSMRNLTQLYNAVDPPTLADLREAVACLLESEALRVVYRVHSPFGDKPGLETYTSFEQIPSTLEDDWQDPPVLFEVGPDNVEVLFTLARACYDPIRDAPGIERL
jgi:hypothetical protein